MILDFIKYCQDKNLPYEKGYNWCDCADYGDYVNFWVDGKIHTFYVLNNGAYKLDNVVVKDIDDIDRRIYG